MFDIVRMVIHHVEDNGNTCFMKGIHHLLELADTAVGVVGISGIATFGHIVVYGIVTPVIFVVAEPRLVH